MIWGNDTLELIPMMSQVCAISSADNGFPLRIPLAGACRETCGFVLCEQSRVFDLDARNAVYKDHVFDDLLERVKNVLQALLD